MIILAAGLGTRMRSSRAKVLHHLDGMPLVNHVVGTALRLDPGKVVVIVGHQADDVERAVRDEFPDAEIEFVLQEKQLGTGDAVNAARQVLAGRESDAVVLSGDVPMIRAETLQELISRHRTDGSAATILSVRLKDPTGYGRILRDSSGAFERVVEEKDATDNERNIKEINSGIYCFQTKKMFSALERVSNDNAQGEYYLTDVPGILRADGDTVAIFECADHREVEGINDREQLSKFEKRLRNANRKKAMSSGVTLVDPKAAYISGRAVIGRDTVVYQSVTIEGKTVIGENCIIRPGVRIVNSTIGDNVEIRDNSFITDSTIGSGCTVGPMAHLRGHAVMEEGSKVGNFVELKKTRLGKRSKASHLTYLGDATIGENTNIGAGTITCNYDGKHKHETHIGNNVKIGSDTMLVAPITVGDGAVTGAGSVVTKDILPNKLAVGAPARSIKDLAEKQDK
jgi:bifunctional UDP-N-acetylglucosamine pyrophosphorylase/glucosamine-1-phosphate N-acetyltransferase